MEFLLLAGILLVLSLVMTVDTSWTNVLTSLRNQLVFSDRNKEYGAFTLRRDYVRRLGFATGASVLFLGIAIGTPKLASLGGDEEVKEKKIVEVNLDLIEEENKEEPPPPPPVEPPPPPKIEQVEFTALEAVDKPVEEPPPTQENLDTVQASTVTVEGENIEEAPVIVEENTEPMLFAAVEEKPGFPGGDAAREAWMKKNTRFPDMEAEQGISGTVYVEFIIDKNGNITEAKVVRGVSAGLDKEALRVIKAMPAWSAGKQNGRPVPVRFTYPVKFTLR